MLPLRILLIGAGYLQHSSRKGNLIRQVAVTSGRIPDALSTQIDRKVNVGKWVETQNIVQKYIDKLIPD